MQFKPLAAALRMVGEPSLHERRLRLQARFATAVAALAGTVLIVVFAAVVRDPSAHMVDQFHVLEAISDAEMVVGLALILASFFLFPPLGLAAVEGGGLVLASTAAAGSFAIAATAGAIMASAGYLMNQASDGGSGSSDGGERPPRFTSNVGRSRTYGKSVSDIKGQARRWAQRRSARGDKVWVGRVRYGKYGHADVTVTTARNGVVTHIRHFIYKG